MLYRCYMNVSVCDVVPVLYDAVPRLCEAAEVLQYSSMVRSVRIPA
jgi:hypothetical protein